MPKDEMFDFDHDMQLDEDSEMTHERFECRASVIFRGKELILNKIISEVEVLDMSPPIGDPLLFLNYNDRLKRRQRFIDLISAQFAQALTEAIFKMHDMETNDGKAATSRSNAKETSRD